MPDKYELLPPLSIDEYEALRADIELNGVRDPIIVDENGDILDGHNRARIDPNAPRIVLTGKTEAEKKAFVYAANFARRNLSSEQKKELHKMMRSVALELKKEGKTQEQIAAMLGVDQTTVSLWLKDESISIMNIHNANTFDCRIKIPKKEHPIIHERVKAGETQEQIAADYKVNQSRIAQIIKQEAKKEDFITASESIENIQTEQVDPKIEVKLGEWWKLGRHLLYCGDTSSQEFINALPDNAAFAFADPPYGVHKADWDNEFYWQHDYLIDKAKVVAVTPGISSIFKFAKISNMPYVWSIACWIDNGMTRGALGFGNWIYVALFSKGSVYSQSQDFIKISIRTNSNDATKHKSIKPSELLIHLLQIFTKDNDIVVDPFLGSGTTLFACEKMSRKCIGGEIEPKHCKEIIERWQKQSNKKAERK